VSSSVRFVVLFLPAMAALIGLVHGQGECILDDEASLSACVKRLLESLRDDIHQKHDPVVIADVSGCDGSVCHTLNNIRVSGLSSYNINDLSVSFPDGQSLSVSAEINWPRLRGNLFARLEASTRIFRKKISASASANPEIRVKNPTGRLTAQIRLEIADDGTVTTIPENVDVGVTLSDIDLELNLNGLGKWVHKLIGNAGDKIGELVVERKWKREWKQKVEREAEEALEKAAREKLGPELSKLLKKVSGV